uniref:Uncharacterized protein n=1 Tax=Magallana gigas TaxID=29159 RepID=K1QD92_MAGGI
MSRFGSQQFIIITLNGDMKHCYNLVISLTHGEEDTKFINLSNKLTKDDRTEIFKSHFTTFTQNKDFSKVKHLALANNEHSLGYPEICALFSRCAAFQNICPILFSSRPLHYLKSHFEEMHESKDNEKFLLLVYMSMNQMEIDITAPNETLFEILRSCSCGTNYCPEYITGSYNLDVVPCNESTRSCPDKKIRGDVKKVIHCFYNLLQMSLSTNQRRLMKE